MTWKLIPTKQQWKDWGLLAKASYAGVWIGVFSLAISLISIVWPSSDSTTNSAAALGSNVVSQVGSNVAVQAGRDAQLNQAGRDFHQYNQSVGDNNQGNVAQMVDSPGGVINQGPRLLSPTEIELLSGALRKTKPLNVNFTHVGNGDYSRKLVEQIRQVFSTNGFLGGDGGYTQLEWTSDKCQGWAVYVLTNWPHTVVGGRKGYVFDDQKHLMQAMSQIFGEVGVGVFNHLPPSTICVELLRDCR